MGKIVSSFRRPKKFIKLLVVAIAINVAFPTMPSRSITGDLPPYLFIDNSADTVDMNNVTLAECWAAQTINAGNISVPSGKNLDLLTLGGEVHLLDGFEAVTGSDFHAYNDYQIYMHGRNSIACPFYNTYAIYDGIGRSCGFGCRIMYLPVTMSEEEYNFYADIIDGQMSQANWDSLASTPVTWELGFVDSELEWVMNYLENEPTSFGDQYWYLYQPYNLIQVQRPDGAYMYVSLPHGEIDPERSYASSQEELEKNLMDLLVPMVPVANIGYYYVTGIAGSNFSGPLTTTEREGNLVFGTVEVVALGGAYLDSIMNQAPPTNLYEDLERAGYSDFADLVESGGKRVDVSHLAGEINNSGEAVGGHFRPNGIDFEWVQTYDYQGYTSSDVVYQAKIEVYKPGEGWILKTTGPDGYSTHFPDSMTWEEIIELSKVAEANAYDVVGTWWKGEVQWNGNPLYIEGYGAILDEVKPFPSWPQVR